MKAETKGKIVGWTVGIICILVASMIVGPMNDMVERGQANGFFQIWTAVTAIAGLFGSIYAGLYTYKQVSGDPTPMNRL